MKYLFILIPILILFSTGCSSPKKKSIFSQEQQAELRSIIDRHLTDDDWDRYQQEWEKFETTVDYDSEIDLRNDYDKDPMILMSIIKMSEDKPELQKELTDFVFKSIGGKERLESLFK